MYRARVCFCLLGLVASSCGPGNGAAPAQDEAALAGEEPAGTDANEGDGVADPGRVEGGDEAAEPVTAEVVGGKCVRVPGELPLAERCAAAGAKVHEFPNACVGICSTEEWGNICHPVVTTHCKCPDGECIDDVSGCCVKLEDWEGFHQEVEHWQEKAARTRAEGQ